MSGSDAMHSEMPGFSPGRPSGEREPLLDMIFDRRPLPPGAPPEMHDLARMLAIAAGRPNPGNWPGRPPRLRRLRGSPPRPTSRPLPRGPARRRLTRRPSSRQTPTGRGAGRGSSRAGKHDRGIRRRAAHPDPAFRPRGDGRPCAGSRRCAGTVWPYQYAFARDDPWSRGLHHPPAIPFIGPNQRARRCKPRSDSRAAAPSMARRPHLHAPGRAGPEPGHAELEPGQERGHAEPRQERGHAEPGQERGHAEPEPHQGSHAWSEPERDSIWRVGRTSPAVGLGRLPGRATPRS